jgi:acetolactate synthase I/II/III large subunit
MVGMDPLAVTAEEVRRLGVRVAFSTVDHHDLPLCRHLEELGIPVVESLHPQTAAFAAEGWAKVTREPSLVILSGPHGLPQALTGLANAFANGSPLMVIDDAVTGVGHERHLGEHLGMASSVVRSTFVTSATGFAGAVARAATAANSPPRGPVLVEISTGADGAEVGGETASTLETDSVQRVGELLGGSDRPVFVAGGGVYWSKAEAQLARFIEAFDIPIIMNGMGRGTVPADHRLAVSRARSVALQEADLVLVAGTPIDFRLGFGRFGEARVVHLCEHHSQVATHVDLAGSFVGDHRHLFEELLSAREAGPSRRDWVERVHTAELDRRAADEEGLQTDSRPIHPLRFFGELRKRLARDAVVIGDGGDFVSYAGRYVDSFTPGCFLDPGPFGCLGIGLGYAISARLAHPRRQVVVLLGDGAAGFSLMELATLVRHGLPIVAVVGNNNGWGLEKHHMQALYGYDVAADLRPDTRYDQVAESMGADGLLVMDPGEIGPALDRAFASDRPVVINMMLDPADVYPRSTVLG